MSLVCPRCRVHERRPTALRVITIPRASGEADLTILGCDRCHGIWLGLRELEVLAPRLAEIAEDMPRETPRRANEIEVCPVCGGEIEGFFYLTNVCLDHCLTCKGVWLDGHEHEGLAHLVARHASSNVTAAYRDAPLPEAHADRQRCITCRALVPTRETLVTEDGAVCLACSRKPLA